jgi:glycosyltransferase involved in cell wall biosynthesis
MPHRVVQFIESGGPGGAEHVMLNLSVRLMQRGHAVLVMAPYEGYVSDRCREWNIPHRILPTTKRLDFSLVRRLREAVATFGGDMVHAHGFDASCYASLAAFGRVPVVATLHGSLKLQPSGAFRRWIKRRVLRLADSTLVTVSDHLRAEILADGVLDEQRVTTIYNGVDFGPRGTDLDPAGLRASLGIPARAPVVGTVANARPEKGYGRFLAAAVRIAGACPDAHFIMAGRLPGRSEIEIRRRIGSMGLEHCVHVLGFRDDIQRVFAMLDVFVLASDTEGFSLATVEAMACKKPVVVTRCGGPQEIVDDEQTGLLAEIDDGSAIADRVTWLLRHPATARAIAERGCERARARFDIAEMVAAYERLYGRTQTCGH